jgi:hypothetical protein
MHNGNGHIQKTQPPKQVERKKVGMGNNDQFQNRHHKQLTKLKEIREIKRQYKFLHIIRINHFKVNSNRKANKMIF